MELISNEISRSTRYTIPFNVNFDSLLEKYGDQGYYKLYIKHNFTIFLEDGTNYPGYIIIFHNKTPVLGFTLIIENEEIKNANLNVDFQLTVNEESHLSKSRVGEILIYSDESNQNVGNVYGIRHILENVNELKSIKGKMTFRIETKSSFHKEFVLNLGLNLSTPCGKEDFTIICKDQKIKFEKQLLVNVSAAFRGMLESPWSEESKNGYVEIKEVKPETILAFKNLLLNSHVFKKEDLTIDMMIFADRFIINALFDLCVKFIDSFDVNDENIFETIQALCLIEKDSFLDKAVLLLKKNYGTLKQDPRWKEFAKTHPDCVFKMFERSI